MTERETGYEKLVEDNRILRERVFELEELLGTGRRQLEQESTRVSRVVHLLQNKDRTLGAYAAELEKKKADLEEAVRRLEKKNQQLQLWVSSLRLYQDILENEASILLGLNREGRLLLYNRAAALHFGEGIREQIGREVESLDFTRLDPYLPVLVRSLLADRKPAERKAEVRGRTVRTCGYPMGQGEDFRGILLRISTGE